MATARIGDALNRAGRIVGWLKPENWPPEADRLTVANEVGELIVNAHPWNWLARPAATVSVVAGQSYLALPADFGRFGSIEPVSGSGFRVRMEDMAAVIRARRASAPGGRLLRGALAFSAPTNTALPAARIEVGPIPAVSAADSLMLAYIATWRTVTSENDVIPMPVWLHGVYFRGLQLYVQGHERDKLGTVEQRLDSLFGSSQFQVAVDRDDTLQCDIGVMRNTLEDMIRGGGDTDEFFSDQSTPIIGT